RECRSALGSRLLGRGAVFQVSERCGTYQGVVRYFAAAPPTACFEEPPAISARPVRRMRPAVSWPPHAAEIDGCYAPRSTLVASRAAARQPDLGGHAISQQLIAVPRRAC